MSLQNAISLGNIPSVQYGLNKILEEINSDPKTNLFNKAKDPSKVNNNFEIKGEKTPILNPNEFLDRISSFLFHLPHQYLYVVHFSKIPSSIFELTNNDNESEEPRSYLYDEFGNKLITEDNQDYLSKILVDNVIDQRGCCWFALDMSLPGEKLNITNGEFMANQQRGGLMGSSVISNREKFDELKLALLETNASFGDLIIRPWIKLVSHSGMIARSDDDPLNCKIDCWITFYSKTKYNSHLVPRKTYFFKDLVPISINSETKTSGDGDIKSEARSVNFTYSYYNIRSELGNYDYT